MRCIVVACLFVMVLIGSASAQQAKSEGGGPPPAPVVTANVEQGQLAPESTFVGTTYFVHLSKHAAEIPGIVESANFDRGDRVKKGQVLVVLNTELLNKEIQSQSAELDQVATLMLDAKKDLSRLDQMLKKRAISQDDFDNAYYTLEELKARRLAAQARLDRLKIRRDKTEIEAAFGGVIVDKHVEVGEWAAIGAAVADVADDSQVEIQVHVPQSLLPYLSPGMDVPVTIQGKAYKGRLFAIIPKGDIRTRTVPVTIRINGQHWVEGLEATVHLPTSQAVETLLVPRDAVLKMRGHDQVVAVVDGKAVIIPVSVVGFAGQRAGVKSGDLKAGMHVVTKGNERLRPGQAVAPTPSS
ncbi:efflux RND transporter periplasmic adaptor subunit [Desulfovibrio inopinatus]|uniref:efflux RND transporter periplasmic adaptor subunit n=1 Tax=Desulfovibrio inopinatus TaxID=102109 RepID=UPI0004023008|nr:efflux RND transporter periplasmic adaptor subunit [Desulfovibrio inopinatus]